LWASHALADDGAGCGGYDNACAPETPESAALAHDSFGDLLSCNSRDPRCAVRWGVAVETALGLNREESQANYHAALRLNVPVTRLLEVRFDFVLGGFPHASFGAGPRVDLQLNLGSVYTLGLGVDAVLAIHGGFVGTHVSVLGFRFGPEREFFVNLPWQLSINTNTSRIILEQLLSVSYLFSS
jgi:hypothetical protein